MKQKILSPAIALLNRLNYTGKFSLLWLLSMIPVAVVVYSLFVSLDRVIQPSQRQLEGIVLIKPISRTTQALQRHRGISTALLSGDETMQDRHAAQEMEVIAAFNAMEEKLPADLASGKNFRSVKINWERLIKEQLSLSVTDNFAAQTHLIEQLLLFETFVADEYMLTLDPELPTFYLIDTIINKLPHTLEHLGQIRAYSTGILVSKPSTKQQKIDFENQKVDLKVMITELDNTLWGLDSNLDKAVRYNPAIREPLRELSENIAVSAHTVTKLVASDILAGRLSTSSNIFLDISTTAIDAIYAQTHDVLLPTTTGLIEARIARAKQALLTSVGIAMLAFLLVVYLSVGIYYAIIGSIQSLARSARAFADGDMSTRIKLGTRDELSWVGDSFNQMADGFNAMLEMHREDEARLRATIETAMDAVVQVNAEGIITGWNNQAEKIFGWSRDEATGRALNKTIIPPQYRKALDQELKRFLLTGEWPMLNSRFEATSLHRDGHEFPIELSIAPIKTAKGYEFSAFIRDITEHKRLEREMRIAAVAFEAHEGIAITDANGVIIRVNRTFTTITGYSAEEAIGNTPRVLKSGRHDGEFYRHMWGTLLRDKYWEGEIWNKRKNGEIYPEWLTVTAVVAEDGKTNNYVAIFIDITERKRYEEQLQSASSELMKANVQIEEERAHLAERVMERTAQLLYANLAKDSFLATMSHEIRTPLGGLLGMMELISLSRLDGKQREMLQAARDSGAGLLRIVDDILDWSKIEAGKLELAPQVATIPEMLRKVAGTYAQLASAKGIMLRLQQVDSKLGVAHLFDPLRLSQILNNFTSNAVKFTEHGTVEISAELVAQSDGKEEICFCVKDTGIGIDEEHQARLFQLYEQASADTARMYGGTGLGLAICRSLAELMQGSISVESTPGLGSTFCFTVSLPVASPAAQRDLQLRQAREDTGKKLADIAPLLKNGKRVSVLLVDDHPINRMLLKQQLELLGMHAEDVAHGIVALSLWKTGRFDLVITDCHMPEMDGYELTRSIREMEQQDGRQRVPIIAWTANVLAKEEERCRAAGMDDILTKPTELADLRNMLLKWLTTPDASLSEASPLEATPDCPSDAGRVSTRHVGLKPDLQSEQDQPHAGTPIDFSVLKKIAKNHAAQAEILQEFNLHNRSDITDLKAALKEGNLADVARLAHRIKGASRMVGALELESICMAIEQAATQSNLDGARKATGNALDATVERIEAAISAFIAVP